MSDTEQDMKLAAKNFEVALSEFTTSLESANSKVEKMRQPEACQCAHCKMHLESLEGETIPMLNGQIAAIRGTILMLQAQGND